MRAGGGSSYYGSTGKTERQEATENNHQYQIGRLKSELEVAPKCPPMTSNDMETLTRRVSEAVGRRAVRTKVLCFVKPIDNRGGMFVLNEKEFQAAFREWRETQSVAISVEELSVETLQYDDVYRRILSYYHYLTDDAGVSTLIVRTTIEAIYDGNTSVPKTAEELVLGPTPRHFVRIDLVVDLLKHGHNEQQRRKYNEMAVRVDTLERKMNAAMKESDTDADITFPLRRRARGTSVITRRTRRDRMIRVRSANQLDD